MKKNILKITSIIFIFVSILSVFTFNSIINASCASFNVSPASGNLSTTFQITATDCSVGGDSAYQVSIDQIGGDDFDTYVELSGDGDGNWSGSVSGLQEANYEFVLIEAPANIAGTFTVEVEAGGAVECGAVVAPNYEECPASCPASRWSDGSWKCGSEAQEEIEEREEEETDNSVRVNSQSGIESCEAIRVGAGGEVLERDPGCVGCIEQGGIWTAIGCVDPTPLGVITGMIRIALGVIGGVTLVQFILAGIYYQSGKEEKITEAKGKIKTTLGGLVILVMSVLILRVLGVNILDVVPSGSF